LSQTVLIVDDSLTVRMDLAQAFDAAGFRTIPCGSAGEARVALAGQAMSAVILDVQLPDGDGLSLVQEVRASPAGAQAAILVLSSAAEVQHRLHGLRTGADEFVGKPYDVGYVVARARELVRARAAPGAGGARVLVIDDSLTFREEMRRALQAAGYAAVTASTGEEGLRLAAEERPRAILVDGQLPGIDGATVIRQVRLDSALRGTPCVLVTARQGRGAELRALDAGADAFVRKEDEAPVILAKLEALLRTAPAAAHHTVSLQGPKRLLVVDDDGPGPLQRLSDALHGAGYDLVVARSGDQALELLTVQPVDCILLHLTSAERAELTCGRIKATAGLREVPLLLLTAGDDREALIRGLAAGADDCIPPSSEPEVLRARVRTQLRRKQLETEGQRARDETARAELEAARTHAARQLAEARAVLVQELERKNREMEAFSYSVSHDLRAPLRTIDGFARALAEDHAGALDEQGRHFLDRVRSAAVRMGELIDDLLELSRVERADLRRVPVDMAETARAVLAELRRKEPDRPLQVQLADALPVAADPGLLQVVLENLLGNAWKFTARVSGARIELGSQREENGGITYFVRDNGAGFDMTFAYKLFRPFQRLHTESDFPGTGIGLATVQRVVERHGGRVWAQSSPGGGATFYFTIPPPGGDSPPGDP
jgi:two-component system NtrC family sensor kinase